MQHRELVLKLAAIGIGMFFFGFALVPLYEVFCEITGLGGRTNATAVAAVEENPDRARTVRVEFLAAVAPTAPWEFRPSVSSVQVHPGEIIETTYLARNLTGASLTGQAVPSIAPLQATQYFHKTECFCFTPQQFGAQQARELSVRFIVDPKLPATIDRLTLGYAMYDMPEQKQIVSRTGN